MRDVGPQDDLTRLSKAMTHALRHEPWRYGLELDEEGWVAVDDLVAALRRHSARWRELTRADIAEVVATSDKNRFELTERAVRARYGHSVPGRIRQQPATPPERLYHGTPPEALVGIVEQGLLPMRRQYVHLSVDRATATQVGRRRSPRPVVLVVRAREAHVAGVRFWRGNEIVWLADRVPPEFIAW